MSRHEFFSQLLTREGLYQGPITTTQLEGGVWNDVVKVETGNDRYIFKTSCEVPQNSFFPNVAAHEAKALRRLSELDISPEFIGFWPDDNLLVYKYVEGRTWNGDIASVARLLVRKETVDPTGFPLGKLTPHELLAEGDEMFAKCQHAKIPMRPAPIDIEPPERLSLVHRDVGPNNLVGEGEKLRLIDWQCPTMGDLTEDIFSFLSPAFQIMGEREPLTDEEQSQFFQALDLPQYKKRFELLAPYFSWCIAAYCSLRAEVHTDSIVRQVYRKAAKAEYEFLQT